VEVASRQEGLLIPATKFSLFSFLNVQVFAHVVCFRLKGGVDHRGGKPFVAE